jgi:hypothetical protein
MTLDQVKAVFRKIIGPKADSITAGTPWPTVTNANRINPLPAGVPTGSCCYDVDGKPVCVDGLTQDECQVQLGGIFDPTVPCAQRHCT